MLYSISLFCVLLSVYVIYLINYAYTRHKNFPPGPKRLPYFGSYLFILAEDYSNLAEAMKKICKKYKSSVIGFYLGHLPAILVRDPKLIREVFFSKAFDGRTDMMVARLRSFWKLLGVFFTDGYFWHTQRRFSLRYMRDYGFGRRDETLEGLVEHDIKEIIHMATQGPTNATERDIVKGSLVQLPAFFAPPGMNGLLHVLTGTTLPRSEWKKIYKHSQHTREFSQNTDNSGRFLVITPWIKNFLPKWSKYEILRDCSESMQMFFKNFVDDAIATHDSSHDRHFLDVYIRNMKEEAQMQEQTTFSDEQLLMTCVDFMLPTGVAISNFLSTIMEQMIIHPEVQVKIHEEIDRVVGRDRMPNLDDRANMPYTEACIRETLRHDTTVPLGLAHRAQENTQLGGYDIPVDTVVMVHLENLHMDKELWGDPENFRPERFIEDEKLKVALDKSLPFGAGSRLCAGETFTRQTVFQIFAGTMQAFHVSTPDGKPLTKRTKRICGIINLIEPHFVKFTPRF